MKCLSLYILIQQNCSVLTETEKLIKDSLLRINSGDCQPANVEAELQTKESVETRYWNTIMEINNKVKAAYAYIFWDCSETESKGNLPKQKKKKKK